MSYQLFVESLSQHGRDILAQWPINESILPIIDPEALRRAGLRAGDLVEMKKFLGLAKRPREYDDDEERHGERTVAAPEPNFAKVEDAFNALSLRPNAPAAVVVELSAVVKRYNDAAIKEGLISGVKKVMTGFGQSVDKSRFPLMCVLGAAGQGKTDTLNFVRRNAGIQKLVIEVINKHIKSLKLRLECKHVIALFATFDLTSTYDVVDEPAVQSALCNRLLSNYLGVTFDSSQSKRFDNMTLEDLTEFVRRNEAAKRSCAPCEVCVFLLVDEVLKVGAGREPRENVSILLDAICTTQHSALEGKALTFAVVTSQVDGMHLRMTTDSLLPLHSIPLYPCRAADIDDLVGKMIERAVSSNRLELACAADARAELLWAAHATGGHFRSLATLWFFFIQDPSLVARPQIIRKARTAANLLDVMAQRLHKPTWAITETTHIGATFSKQGVSMTLYDAAMSNAHGVFYEETDAKDSLVRPCVMPCGLSERSPFEGDTAVAQSIVKLWERMHKLLTSVKANAIKGWEMGVPLLEVVASTLMYEVNGKVPVAFCDVWREAHVQCWGGQKAKLFYRPLGSGCVDVYKLGATESTEAADDAWLRKVCESSEPTLSRAETPNYPSIKGAHTLLEVEEESPSGLSTRSLVPVVIQMKAHNVVTGRQLVRWATAAHVRARKHLCLADESYFVILYVSNTPNEDNWKWRIPGGTIVIKRDALTQFLSPFGMTPLLHMLDTHAAALEMTESKSCN